MIHVTPLSHLAETLAGTRARTLMSLLSVGIAFKRPAHLEPANCLHLSMHDIVDETPGLVAPSRNHVAEILAFARKWDRKAPLVVHCHAGISRSTAAAYAIVAALHPELDERELARDLRTRSPSATPNIRIIKLADDLLRREGKMTEAILSIGRGAESFEGTPFAFPCS